MKILSLGLYLDKFPIVFQNFDFWPLYGLFLGIFWRFSGIFCPSTQEHNIWKILSLGLYLDTFSIVFQILIATGHTFWPRNFFLKIWSLEMYQEISYEIVIFDHIGGGLAFMNIYGKRLLRPERSSAARRCACTCKLFFFAWT